MADSVTSAPDVAVLAAVSTTVGSALTGAAGAAGAGALDSALGAFGAAGVTGAVACGAAEVLAAALLAARFFGGFFSNSSANRRTTGASIVEDADRTNSPMSFSLVRTTLLVTPSSFASS
jgi:Zn-dependent alcohol dehydrogenase